MKKKYFVAIMTGLLVLSVMSNGNATPFDQYATSVIDFSSQWSANDWSANQALGAPNTFSYGDIVTAWAPLPMNGTSEYLFLGFDTPVYAYGATIRETYGNGFVTQIDLLDLSSTLHTVWAGTDLSQPGSPVDFQPSWTQTTYLVNGIKIYIDTNHNLDAWEEIDSVRLNGDTTAPVPEPTTMFMFGTGIAGLVGTKLRRKRQ